MTTGHIGSMTARDAEELGMKVKGYDPGLSVERALKLPRSIDLGDSLAAAVAGADYISLNIPYIKGEGGTHGIIGKEIISYMSPNAVILNFARGELVDSDAMKEFLDSGNGRYVTDFPDDVLWDHKNCLVLPHLGASTEEAEDAAVRLEHADFVRLWWGGSQIRNSFCLVVFA
jgi:D-3-phosphoglycerate dehydrogenase